MDFYAQWWFAVIAALIVAAMCTLAVPYANSILAAEADILAGRRAPKGPFERAMMTHARYADGWPAEHWGEAPRYRKLSDIAVGSREVRP